MIQNASQVSGCRILSPAGTASGHRQKSFNEAIKTRNLWPFTVNTSYEAQAIAESRLQEPANSGSFVT